MAYPRRLLNEGEQIALDLKPHWWFFSKNILTGIPLLVVLVLLFGLDGTLRKVILWMTLIGLIVWLIWLGVQYLQWHLTQFVVTNKRVIFRTGVLRRHGVEVPLERINNIIFYQGLWERLIGAGDLVVESAGESGQSTFTDVQHPDAVQQEIYKRMEENARDRASWGNSMPQASQQESQQESPGNTDDIHVSFSEKDDVIEQIRQLAELRDQGVITTEEFEEKKSELLKRM